MYKARENRKNVLLVWGVARVPRWPAAWAGNGQWSRTGSRSGWIGSAPVQMSGCLNSVWTACGRDSAIGYCGILPGCSALTLRFLRTATGTDRARSWQCDWMCWMWLIVSNGEDVQSLLHLHQLLVQSLLRRRSRRACVFACVYVTVWGGWKTAQACFTLVHASAYTVTCVIDTGVYTCDHTRRRVYICTRVCAFC